MSEEERLRRIVRTLYRGLRKEEDRQGFQEPEYGAGMPVPVPYSFLTPAQEPTPRVTELSANVSKAQAENLQCGLEEPTFEPRTRIFINEPKPRHLAKSHWTAPRTGALDKLVQEDEQVSASSPECAL